MTEQKQFSAAEIFAVIRMLAANVEPEDAETQRKKLARERADYFRNYEVPALREMCRKSPVWFRRHAFAVLGECKRQAQLTHR